MRETRAGVIHAIAGCYVCHGHESHWDSKNALALAAQHHDRTGHPTWAEQCISVKYGHPADGSLPLLEEIPGD